MVERLSIKQLLVDSILELASKTPFNKITVQQIVDNCGVSKRTFYNNFEDKYDLLAHMCFTGIRRTYEETLPTGTFFDFELINVLGVGDTNLFHNFVVSTHGSDSFFRTTYRLTYELLIEHIARSHPDEEIDENIKFAVGFFTHGAIGCIYQNWYIGGMDRSAEDLTRLILEQAPDYLRRRLAFPHGYFPEDNR